MEIFFPGRHNTKLHPIQKVLTNTHLESIPPKQCANGSSSSSLIINSSNSGGEQQLLVVVYKIHSRGKKDHAHTSYKWCTQALCFRQNWPQELPATFAATLVPTKGSGAKTSETVEGDRCGNAEHATSLITQLRKMARLKGSVQKAVPFVCQSKADAIILLASEHLSEQCWHSALSVNAKGTATILFTKVLGHVEDKFKGRQTVTFPALL